MLVENEIYDPHVVDSVKESVHHVREELGITAIAEALEHLQLPIFFKQNKTPKHQNLY